MFKDPHYSQSVHKGVLTNAAKTHNVLSRTKHWMQTFLTCIRESNVYIVAPDHVSVACTFHQRQSFPLDMFSEIDLCWIITTTIRISNLSKIRNATGVQLNKFTFVSYKAILCMFDNSCNNNLLVIPDQLSLELQKPLTP